MSIQTKKDVIFIATAKELSIRSYYRRLWLAVKNIDMPRRSWLDMIADAIRDYDGLICHPNGMRYHIPDVDEAFGDDIHMRWLGFFMTSDATGQHPKMWTRKIVRLQLLDLYFKIKHPDIAAHFGR